MRDKKNKYLKLIPYAWQMINNRSANNPIFKDLNSLINKYFEKKNINMKIKTGLILCAGFGKRVQPITDTLPKPLIVYKNITLLENTINFLIKLKINKIKINVFYLKDQIINFIKNKNFPVNIEIIDDGETILGTGGGILSLIKKSEEEDVLVINPDTIWDDSFISSVIDMENIYFEKKIKNILLVVNNSSCFDRRFNGDFEIKNNILLKGKNK